MINFILKPQLLPINKTTNVHHFYQFQGKQLKQNQIQQKKKLDQLLKKIQEQEKQSKQAKSQIIKKKQLIQKQTKQNAKSYFINSKQQQPNNIPSSTKSFNAFYQKNKKWKQNLQTQILKKKHQKQLQLEKQLSQYRKPLSQKDSFNSYNVSKNNQSLHHAFQSKGPISGWNQRFHQYIKKRLPQAPQNDFKPTINKKSQIIASRMVGKVEDRLIRFGQIMKIRKHEMIIQEVQKIGKLPNSQNHFTSTQTNHSSFFYKLHKQAEHTDRKVKQRTQKKQFSFQPSITKLPQNMEKKVQQKRQKSPLYTSKKFTKQQTQRFLQMYAKQSDKPYSEAQFQNFMKRNQLLLQRKSKNLQKKVKEDLIKEQKDFRQCTFIPILNPKSVKMFQKMQEQRIENQEQYEYSHDQVPMQENPQQLFDNSGKKNIQGSKYSYSHSYTQPGQFEYQIHTPVSRKYENDSLNTISASKQNLNQISQMDSLQFSGNRNNQRHFISNDIFDKNKHIRDRNNSNIDFHGDEQEEINYELTFSNKKLSDQLSSINNRQGGDDEKNNNAGLDNRQRNENKQIKQINIDKELIKNSDKQGRQYLYESRKQTIQNSWQTQLQRVKNRLQGLMRSKQSLKKDISSTKKDDISNKKINI